MKPKLHKSITSIGRSVQGQSIDSYIYSEPGQPTKPEVLIMSGLHGDEVEGIILNNQLSSAIQADKQAKSLLEKLTFLPIANRG